MHRATPLLALLALIPLAGAAHAPYATFSPNDTSHQWDIGETLRICATETPTGDATITPPTAANVFTQTADSDHCWTLTQNEVGLWSISWPVGLDTRTVHWSVSEGGDNWERHLDVLVIFALFLVAALWGWLWVMGFSAIGLIAKLWVTSLNFGLEWVLVLAVAGILMEVAANGFKRAKVMK